MSQEQEPSGGIIDRLQEHLDDALAGEIQAVAIATLRRDGRVYTSWSSAEGVDLSLITSGFPVITDEILRHLRKIEKAERSGE